MGMSSEITISSDTYTVFEIYPSASGSFWMAAGVMRQTLKFQKITEQGEHCRPQIILL